MFIFKRAHNNCEMGVACSGRQIERPQNGTEDSNEYDRRSRIEGDAFASSHSAYKSCASIDNGKRQARVR